MIDQKTAIRNGVEARKKVRKITLAPESGNSFKFLNKINFFHILLILIFVFYPYSKGMVASWDYRFFHVPIAKYWGGDATELNKLMYNGFPYPPFFHWLLLFFHTIFNIDYLDLGLIYSSFLGLAFALSIKFVLNDKDWGLALPIALLSPVFMLFNFQEVPQSLAVITNMLSFGFLLRNKDKEWFLLALFSLGIHGVYSAVYFFASTISAYILGHRKMALLAAIVLIAYALSLIPWIPVLLAHAQAERGVGEYNFYRESVIAYFMSLGIPLIFGLGMSLIMFGKKAFKKEWIPLILTYGAASLIIFHRAWGMGLWVLFPVAIFSLKKSKFLSYPIYTLALLTFLPGFLYFAIKLLKHYSFGLI